MSVQTIKRDFLGHVSAQIRLVVDGDERFRVLTPFTFDDGDCLVIVLKKMDGRWVLSDEAHTYMHLSYDIDEKALRRGTRQKIINNTLSMFGMEERGGELILEVLDARYGDALYAFAQALLRIADVKYLSKERVYSTFQEEFRALLHDAVPQQCMTFDWNDATRDPHRTYRVDCRIDGTSRPLLVYALSNDSRTRDATIALHQFKQWGIPFRSVGIFKNPKATSRKAATQFSDVCDKQFSDIALERVGILAYLGENISV